MEVIINHEPITFQTCASCSEMLSSFNSSYGDLKCAEMEANWSLQQLANVIRFADYDPARRTKFKETVDDLQNDNHLIDDMIEVISTFRKQLQIQCRLQYMNQFPRVVLIKPSLAQNSTDNTIPDKRPFPLPTQSTDDFIIAALKNLSSLQLILYLALFDYVSMGDTNISKTKFMENDSLEPLGKKGSSETFHPRVSKEHKERDEMSSKSPSSLICIVNGDGMDDEWDPDVVVQCSSLDVQEADSVPSLCKTLGCRKQLDAEASLAAHELECHTKLDKPHQRKIVVHLKDLGVGNGDSDEARTENGDGSAKIYTQYRIQITENVTTLRCSSCQMVFSSEQELEQHFTTCSKTGHDLDATNTSSCNVQIKQERIEKPFKCVEEGCNKAFAYQRALRSHLQKCHQQFSGDKIRHRATNNGSLRKYICHQCGQRYKTSSNLRSHKLIHLGPESWKHCCSYCGKKFVGKSDLEHHLRTHTRERPFKCSENNCEKAYKSRRSLQRHQQIHNKYKATDGSSNIFRCTQCEYRCNSSSSFHYHRSTHLKPEGWKHSCSYCGKKIILRQNMETHLRGHTVEKPYKCPVDNCTIALAHTSGLRQKCPKNKDSSKC